MAMSKMALSGKSFKPFPCARYATGVTFQQANRPAGTHSEAITLLQRQASLGSVSYTTIFRENDAFHLNTLKKRLDEMHLEDDGPFTVEYPRDWDVLTDKGVSHDRVIVENYFGRMKTLWGVCFDKWRWDEGAYDLFFRVCLALTNAHVRLRPLRAEEGDDYQRYDARLCEIGFSIKAREKERRANY
ncbi:hypothetical protein PF002_g19957 [Phytophthora fragariae]|uniref:DDE Tnp4 domain-containing protein n=1 Tax=Phytophthora fragariae TaxID=53985 RepID=A0A6A3XW16_9STRA|nr:hypothetical protein PF002_g19957 [Phytophthora fragariae]